MDLNKKLDFYRQHSAADESKKIKTSPSLQALADEFGGEICEPAAPYLEIKRMYEFTANRKIPGKIKRTYINRLPREREVEPRRCLFFDLETTGLAGGAGTFAFLLGFAFFEENRLKVIQYFLPDYGREYHLFKNLQQWFGSFDTLVSFNGKSYDLPLLKNRFVINRLNLDALNWLHFDLLHAARRLWKDSFPSCDLSTLEEKLLQRSRNDDIPGAYIPQSYFSFLQTGAIHDIKRIIHHNYLDLVSLAELFLLVEEVNAQPELLDISALVRFISLAYTENDLNTFERLLAILREKEKLLPANIKMWYSLLLKRSEKWPQATALWQELINDSHYSFFALEELAKYYEHHSSDVHKALKITEQALHKLEILYELNPYAGKQEWAEAFKYRRQRLLRRIS